MKIVQIFPRPEIDSMFKTVRKNMERQLLGPHKTREREKEVADATDGLVFLGRVLQSAPVDMRTDKN